MKEKQITIANRIDQLDFMVTELEILCEEWEIPMNISINLNLVLEELVTNIIFYGYEDQNEHEINIHFTFDDNRIEIVLVDDAKEFNLLLAAEPEFNTPIEEMKIGGLGIHLVKKIMNEIKYERSDNKNILKLVKNLN